MGAKEPVARRTRFDHPDLPSMLLSAGEKFYLSGRHLLVNFHPYVLKLNNHQQTCLAAFSSSIRCNESVMPAQSCLIFELPQELHASPAIAWAQQERYPGARSRAGQESPIDFFRSPADEIATVNFPPQWLVAGSDAIYDSQRFALHANLWFADAGTHCGIHHEHGFIEIHTQILGMGRMQIFQHNDVATLCGDMPLAPGTTTSQAFCHIRDAQQYIYPHHQYYADTPSTWLALEYTPYPDTEVIHVRQ